MQSGWFICWLFLPMLSFSQGQTLQFMRETNSFLSDGNGNPMYLRSGYQLEGSPFYKDEYSLARITTRKGNSYQDIPVKLNLMTQEMFFRVSDGREMIPILPVAAIRFDTAAQPGESGIFLSGFPAIDKQTENSFYQLIDSGRAMLLKFNKVNYRDEKPFNSGVTHRIFETTPVLYAYTADGVMVQLSKAKAPLAVLFKDRIEPMAIFIRDNDLSLRKEEDLVKIFRYYDSISR